MKHILHFTLALIIYLLGGEAFSQCTPPTISIGADTVLCEGDTIFLNGDSALFEHIWSSGDSSFSVEYTQSGQYVYSGFYHNNTSPNLVTNGDFSLGNTGFSSGYGVATPPGGTWGLLSNANLYTINTNSSNTHVNFSSCTDHTTGTGNFMICNGSSIPGAVVWSQTITVSPSTNYEYSSWFTSVDPGSPGKFMLFIDNQPIGDTVHLTSTTCLWEQLNHVWQSGPTQNSVVISITSWNVNPSGNDFGLDDISFREVCKVSDTINVDIQPYPIIELGEDTVVCPGNTLVLDATDSTISTYQWSNGNATQFNSINATDSTLWVDVTTNGCTTRDSIIVTVSAAPIVDLGADRLHCPGEVVDLMSYWPNATYNWSTGQTDDTISVTQQGNYWLEITDHCGTNSDTVFVEFLEFPLVDFGPDTALCQGDTLVLRCKPGLDSYSWNTGHSDSTLVVTQSGYYFAEAFQSSCSDKDTIYVQFTPSPTVDLGNDTTFCQGEHIVLDAFNTSATYEWHNGTTNQIFYANVTGIYAVTVSIGDCSASDSIDITVLPIPVVNLGNDTSVCEGQTITLDATSYNATYLWNNQSTDSVITVSESGTYSVEVSNVCGNKTASIEITVNAYPQPNLGDSFDVCIGDTLELFTGYPSASHVWLDSTLEASFMVTNQEYVWVAVTENGCTGYDSAEINVIDLPENILGNDTVICNGQELVFDFSAGNPTVLWHDDYNNFVRELTTSGNYWVSVTYKGCVASDTIDLEVENCDLILEFPNIFTPNGDGENDVFIPISNEGVLSGTLSVYNRWGQLIFESSDTDFEWDGKSSSGEAMPDGVYFYTVKATGEMNRLQEISGTVTISGNN